MFFDFLARTTNLEKYYFYVPKICLRVMGFWPASPRTQLINVWSVFNFLILLIGVLTELHAGFSLLSTNLEKALDTLCPAGTSAVTVLKMILISYYRKDFILVLEKMHQMLFGDYRKDNKYVLAYKRIIRHHSVMAARVNFTPFLAGFITCTAYNLKPLVLAWIFWSKGKEIVWLTPFNMTILALVVSSIWAILWLLSPNWLYTAMAVPWWPKTVSIYPPSFSSVIGLYVVLDCVASFSSS
uniref:Uncharacterized protein n=1 Tax=Stomoxys calcitrans TaxID=35570 RepID=A0A1I8P3P3_STOCA